MWKVLTKEIDLGEPTSFVDHVYLGCTQRKCEISKDIVDNYRTMFESRISAGGVENLPFPQHLRISSWSFDMAGHAKKCVERYCELANKTTQQLHKVSTPCIEDHHFKEEETKSVGELSNTCSQIVLKCLYLARIGRPDILWSVNKFARSITKWTKACDKRLNRLISYIHHTPQFTKTQIWKGSCQDPIPPEFQDKVTLTLSCLGGHLQIHGDTDPQLFWESRQRFQKIATTLADLNAEGLNVQTVNDLLTMYVGAASQHVLRMSFVSEQEAKSFDTKVTAFCQRVHCTSFSSGRAIWHITAFFCSHVCVCTHHSSLQHLHFRCLSLLSSRAHMDEPQCRRQPLWHH